MNESFTTLTETALSEETVVRFQQALLKWYGEKKRPLPWRQDHDPYKIWVSEVMLQQTRVDTVIPYYEKFIDRYPTLNDLARADEADVLKLWEGLGYYSRARNLLAGVREVAARYGGQVPDEKEAILSIKGIGPYTAGAILSIAYGKPVPAVDGNVLRVMARLFAVREDIAKAATKKRIEALVERLIPAGDASSFNQGLMELGSLVCLPRSPACAHCPVQRFCRAYREGRPEAFPVKTPKSRPRPVGLAAAVLWRDDQVLIRQRPQDGLLARLWEFPTVEWNGAFDRWQTLSRDEKVHWLKARLEALYPYRLHRPRYLSPLRHVFSHLKWDGEVYEFTVGMIHEGVERNDDVDMFGVDGTLASQWRWVGLDELPGYAFPVPHRKIVERLLRTARRENGAAPL